LSEHVSSSTSFNQNVVYGMAMGSIWTGLCGDDLLGTS
jgi:hypothetical protein